jgi:hypothetical protein
MRLAMANKTDEELYDILYVHSGDYTTDALESAREEFVGRKLDASTLGGLCTTTEVLLQREAEPLGWPLRMVAFFFSTLFFGIPVLLAHRHYVEQGAKRKAREWGRWGLIGFAFYVTLSVIMAISPRFIK